MHVALPKRRPDSSAPEIADVTTGKYNPLKHLEQLWTRSTAPQPTAAFFNGQHGAISDDSLDAAEGVCKWIPK